ncbi:MAG: hypothetical protein H8D23_04985 [Candidatus Brocadiales bacterium]|nr:hypothetical protein [Candidatus Brocadiales bacterium]
MTAQTRDSIYVDGKWRDLACEPLSTYLEEQEGSIPEFMPFNTACWRGYVAKWKIFRNKLYLTRVDGYQFDKSKVRKKHLFPDSKGKVFAEWYTGHLCIPMGKLLEYVHCGYESVFDRELIISVEKGVVVDRKIIENDLESWDKKKYFEL